MEDALRCAIFWSSARCSRACSPRRRPRTPWSAAPTSPDGDAPFAVALLAGASSSAEDWERVFCGGSLIDARTVLTAAHCAAQIGPRGAEVLAGRTNLLDDGGVRVRVASTATHPGFDPATFRDDVAILRLASPVAAAPIALATAGAQPVPGTPATVLGWGALAEGQRTQTAWLQGGTTALLDDARVRRRPRPGLRSLQPAVREWREGRRLPGRQRRAARRGRRPGRGDLQRPRLRALARDLRAAGRPVDRGVDRGGDGPRPRASSHRRRCVSGRSWRPCGGSATGASRSAGTWRTTRPGPGSGCSAASGTTG